MCAVEADPDAQGQTALGPGPRGYVLAVSVALVLFASELGFAFAMGGVPDYWQLFFTVVLVGAGPAAIVGAIGAVVLELSVGRWRPQWPAVLLSAALGWAVGALLFFNLGAGLLLAIPTGLGRLVVVPLVVRRRRSQISILNHYDDPSQSPSAV